MKNLDRSSLILALKELGKHALEESVELEICIYGGSAMLLAYDSRNATKDIDAICKPREIAKSLASKVARKLDLHEDWLKRSSHSISRSSAFPRTSRTQSRHPWPQDFRRHIKLPLSHESSRLSRPTPWLPRRSRRPRFPHSKDRYSFSGRNPRARRPALPR